jgi:predicted nucleic-acid-binding protein
LLQDDPTQTRQVNQIFESQLSESKPGFINLVTVLEVVWVLRSLLKQTPAQIATQIENLLTSDFLEVQNEQQVFEAAFALKRGTGEFEDALIGALNSWSGCSHTLTFDRGAAKLAYFKEIV